MEELLEKVNKLEELAEDVSYSNHLLRKRVKILERRLGKYEEVNPKETKKKPLLQIHEKTKEIGRLHS